jgi:hypothetical protein
MLFQDGCENEIKTTKYTKSPEYDRTCKEDIFLNFININFASQNVKN